MIDFTDSQNPIEIAYFDRGPINDEHLILGAIGRPTGNGKIYGTEIARGLDVLSLLPSEYLTDHEIAAASMANQGAVFNPQQQLEDDLADASTVAHAYLDQLERDGALPEDSVLQLRSALDQSVNQWETCAR